MSAASAMDPPPRSALRRLLVVVLAASLCACAAPQIAYKKLDWLASWKLGQYVDLKSAQERQFESGFQQLWDWHRATELAEYTSDLRALAQRTQSPMSAAEVRQWADRATDHSRRVVARAAPPACELMASFDDTQRDSVLERIDKDIADDVEEYLDPPVAQVRKDARKRMRKTLTRWVGHLEPAQEAMLDGWSEVRPQRYGEWIAERRRWRDRLAGVLDQRTQPQFCEQLRGLLLPEREHDADLVNQQNAQTWFNFLSAFSATLDARQREHLQGKLLELAKDFDALKT